MSKIIIRVFVVFLSIFVIACKSHTIIDFESDEIPSRALPVDIEESIANKYRIGEVLVLPSVQHANVEKSTYSIRIDAFSKKKYNLNLKNIVCEIDSYKVDLGDNFGPTKFPDWEYKENYNLFFSQIFGNAFSIPTPENKKRIDVTIAIEINFGENGNINRVIRSVFYPKKRKYLE